MVQSVQRGLVLSFHIPGDLNGICGGERNIHEESCHRRTVLCHCDATEALDL